MRCAFAVALALGVWFALPLADDIEVVLVMLLFAPVASMVVGFSEEAGLDVETSAFITSVSILVAIRGDAHDPAHPRVSRTLVPLPRRQNRPRRSPRPCRRDPTG